MQKSFHLKKKSTRKTVRFPYGFYYVFITNWNTQTVRIIIIIYSVNITFVLHFFLFWWFFTKTRIPLYTQYVLQKSLGNVMVTKSNNTAERRNANEPGVIVTILLFITHIIKLYRYLDNILVLSYWCCFRLYFAWLKSYPSI